MKPIWLLTTTCKRAANRITRQLRQIQRFLNHAFARKRGVAVNQNHHAAFAHDILNAVLFGAKPSRRHGINEFEVRRVKAQRQLNAAPARRLPVVDVAEMVFDIATAQMKVGVFVFKLAENLARRFADDVGQHVQATTRCAMPMTTSCTPCSPASSIAKSRQWQERFRSFKGKRFGASELPPDELFKNHGIGQARKNANLFFAVKLDADFVWTPCAVEASAAPRCRLCA